MTDTLSIALGGLMAQSRQLSTTASNIANATTTTTGTLATDLPQEIINLIEIKTAFKANLDVIKTQNEMMGDLLDTVV